MCSLIFCYLRQIRRYFIGKLHDMISIITVMEALQNLSGETRKLLPLLPDAVAVGVAIATGIMLGTGASRKAGIFSVCHPVLVLLYSLMSV